MLYAIILLNKLIITHEKNQVCIISMLDIIGSLMFG